MGGHDRIPSQGEGGGEAEPEGETGSSDSTRLAMLRRRRLARERGGSTAAPGMLLHGPDDAGAAPGDHAPEPGAGAADHQLTGGAPDATGALHDENAVLAAWDATPALHQAKLDLLALGVHSSELGMPGALGADAAALVDEARQINHHGSSGGGRLGSPDRLVDAWNNHRDDLGPGRHYDNLLLYVQALNLLAQQQGLGSDYLEAVRHMQETQLAGMRLVVNPRALYFIAAAQLGMDRASGTAEGHGHYVPAGGFAKQLQDFRQMLGLLAPAPAPRHARGGHSSGGGGGGASPDGAQAGGHPMVGGRDVLVQILAELRLMADVLESQRTGRDPSERGYHHDEHIEPELAQLFAGLAPAIRSFQVPDDAGVPEAARRLLELLGGAPHGGRHGAGALDPHGTEHAMGEAVDIYNGRTGALNFGLHDARYLPFIQFLIERYGAYYQLDGLRVHSIQDLQPEQARRLSALVQAKGEVILDELRQQAATREPESAEARRADTAALHVFRDQQGAGNVAFTNLEQALGALANAQLSEHAAADVARQRRELAEAKHALWTNDPAGLAEIVRVRGQALAQLIAELRAPPGAQPGAPSGAQPGAPAAGAGAAPRHHHGGSRHHHAASLPELLETLTTEEQRLTQLMPAILAHAGATRHANEAQQQQQLGELARDGRLRAWIRSVGEGGLDDQPSVLVNALNDVHSPDTGGLLGSHHWAIAEVDAGRSQQDATQHYENDIVRDIRSHHRTPEDVQHILTIMAQSDGGRVALFGAEQPPQPADAALRQALAQGLGNDASVQAIYDAVKSGMVTPFEGGGHDRISQLRRLCRDRGMFLP